MIWELSEHLKKLFKMTVRPAMKNLFSSKRSALGMLCAMLILQILLSVICISGIENMRTQKNLLDDHFANFSQLESQEGSTNDEISETEALDEGQKITSTTIITALNSIPIFAGTILIWGLTSIIVYQRISSASADRNRYVWGMYVTYGAKKKKIRNILKYELYSVQAVVILPAYFISLAICNFLVKEQGFHYKFDIISLLFIILLSYVCIRLVVFYEVKLIQSKSCVYLLKGEEGPAKVISPGKPGKLSFGFSPRRYALSAFFRLRKYYITLALAAAVPAILWICCITASYGQTQFLANDIKEYEIKLENGISESVFSKKFITELESIYGVSSISAYAKYPASEIGMYLMSDRSNYKDETLSTLTAYDVYADGDATIVSCNDKAFTNYVGFQINVPRGKVAIIYPSDQIEYIYDQTEDTVCFALSKNGGTLSESIKNVKDTLSENIESNDYEYVLFDIFGIYSLRRSNLSSTYLNVEKTYFILNEYDYDRVTALTSSSFKQSLESVSVTFDNKIQSNGSFDIIVTEGDLNFVPKAGDHLRANGTVEYNIELINKDSEVLALSKEINFRELYINYSSKEESNYIINVTPKCSVTMKPDIAFPTVVYFGTPSFESSVEDNRYVAATCDTELVKIVGTVRSFSASNGEISTGTALRAIDAGSHIKLGAQNFAMDNIPASKLLLDILYANNEFDIICGDKTTTEYLNIEEYSSETGKAVVVLPEDYQYDFDLSGGDVLYINITDYNVSRFSEDSWQMDTAMQRLEDALKKKYEYCRVEISEINYDGAATRPMIILSDKDFATVINKDAPYVNMNIYIDRDIDSTRFVQLDEIIKSEVGQLCLDNKNSTYHINSTGAFLEFMLRKNSNYGIWFSLIGNIIPLILPFVWYYPLSSLFERRRYDFVILKNLGRTRKDINRIFFIEGVCASAISILSLMSLTYPCMWVFSVICKLFELPIDFDLQYLTLDNVLLACFVNVLCVILSFTACYFVSRPRNVKIKKAKTERS